MFDVYYKENKMEEFKNDIGTLNASVKKLEPEYNKNTKLKYDKMLQRLSQ